MTKIIYTLTMLLIITVGTTKAQDKGTTVINLKMIERFNNVEVDEDFTTFNQLIEDLSFDEMKDVYAAYESERININSKSEVYLAIQQRKMNPGNTSMIKKEKEIELLSDNK